MENVSHKSIKGYKMFKTWIAFQESRQLSSMIRQAEAKRVGNDATCAPIAGTHVGARLLSRPR